MASAQLTEITTLDDESLSALQRVRAACATGDQQDPLDESAALRLKHRGLEGSRLWLVGDSGFALLHEDGVDIAVAPSARGAGFGTTLADATAHLALSAWSHGDHPAAAVLAEQRGFDRARELWVMRRPVALELPESSTSVGIRGFQEGDAQELLRVNAAAFATHPEQGSMDADNLAERMAEPWFDPAGLLVATEGDRMLGFHWTKQHSEATGEVYVVGIDPEAQGRGLGKALTLAGLQHLASALAPDGEVILYVESDNLPARAVYEGLGFTHADADTHVQYRRGSAAPAQ
ncbi:mycothiol synthase [Nocardioides sp. JQ2195]|uniref:mycothiol synthase n=1 Tax=Nocardioides sp. JQ2195 TaxID=2592334 RepID=UPI00143E69FF|nr:mycothiol synthase [Nocardioides sp. JQ2195]QIX25475.1 mycothiol synthase [Nocardioides sp. JQ2195]